MNLSKFETVTLTRKDLEKVILDVFYYTKVRGDSSDVALEKVFVKLQKK